MKSMPGYGDAVTWGGRTYDYDESKGPQVSIPLWLAQCIQWDLEKSGSNYVNSLKSAIARARKENER